MTLTRLESLLLFNVLELAPNSDQWAADCRRALYGPPDRPAEGRLRDKLFRRQCLGAVFRRAAKADPGWFLEICRLIPDDVLAFAPYVTPSAPRPIVLRIEPLGITLGPGMAGWSVCVESIVEAAFVVTAATPLSGMERTVGEETVVQKTEAALAGPVAAAEVEAAQPPTIVIQPKAAKKRVKLEAASAQGGLF